MLARGTIDSKSARAQDSKRGHSRCPQEPQLITAAAAAAAADGKKSFAPLYVAHAVPVASVAIGHRGGYTLRWQSRVYSVEPTGAKIQKNYSPPFLFQPFMD